MHISRVRIVNFANFDELDIQTGEDMVIVGENKAGKSNFLRALQLILDPSLSERDRRLSLEQFWDGLGEDKIGQTVEISVELTEADPASDLLVHLADSIVRPGPPFVARLTYRFAPKPDLERDPISLADYEYMIFGGDDPDNTLRADLRRMLPMDVQSALRDAEKDLASWRSSPLRPLIEDLVNRLDEDHRGEIQDQIDAAQTALNDRDEIVATADRISNRLVEMVGDQHAVSLSLGLAPTRLESLLRGLRILIDNNTRTIADASLGTANLIFLALKSLELDRVVEEGERDHTFFAVEEPEAHLHPHVQRLVYRHFLGPRGAVAAEDRPRRQTTILTTHSPHIASVAPLDSIVLLRRDAGGATIGATTAAIDLTPAESADLQRYIDVTRGEIFFARGVIFVEGDAERFLVPAFAEARGLSLDGLGVTVCSVAGTNFGPYVKLAKGLEIPFVVITDRDAADGVDLGKSRLEGLLELLLPPEEISDDEEELFADGEEQGIFFNERTLETDLFENGMAGAIQAVLLSQRILGPASISALAGWVGDTSTLDQARLLRMIGRIGKGRFAQLLSARVTAGTCPPYIAAALDHIANALP